MTFECEVCHAEVDAADGGHDYLEELIGPLCSTCWYHADRFFGGVDWPETSDRFAPSAGGTKTRQ